MDERTSASEAGWRARCYGAIFPRRDCGTKVPTRVKARHADDQSADPPSAGGAEVAQESAGAAAEPAEAWGLHARLHDDTEETELGAAQGREGAPHQWLRSDRLHSGRRR